MWAGRDLFEAEAAARAIIDFSICGGAKGECERRGRMAPDDGFDRKGSGKKGRRGRRGRRGRKKKRRKERSKCRWMRFSGQHTPKDELVCGCGEGWHESVCVSVCGVLSLSHTFFS